jgi:hypothetical protein
MPHELASRSGRRDEIIRLMRRFIRAAEEPGREQYSYAASIMTAAIEVMEDPSMTRPVAVKGE